MARNSIRSFDAPCWKCTRPLDGARTCGACKAYNTPMKARPDRPGERRILCDRCRRYLATAHMVSGRIEFHCRMCNSTTLLTEGPTPVTVKPCNHDQPPSKPLSMDDLIELMEAKWEAFRLSKLRTKGAIAVGIRFSVFARDGFRCRYCGASVEDGVPLHADHVIPVSAGGETTLDNLVTACFDCNLGKTDRLGVVPPAAVSEKSLELSPPLT